MLSNTKLIYYIFSLNNIIGWLFKIYIVLITRKVVQNIWLHMFIV